MHETSIHLEISMGNCSKQTLSKTPNINNLRSSGKQPTFTLDTEFDNIKYVLRSVAVYMDDCGNTEQGAKGYLHSCGNSSFQIK